MNGETTYANGYLSCASDPTNNNNTGSLPLGSPAKNVDTTMNGTGEWGQSQQLPLPRTHSSN